MSISNCELDAVVIGGGFYGASVAIYLRKHRGMNRILLIERENSLLSRASYNNQARVHNGYHYPRSFTTAFRSRVNLPKFVRDWPDAVKSDFTKLYAIAKGNSKVTSKQFARFCTAIDAKLRPAKPSHKSLFDPRLIEDVFEVDEFAFDSAKLADWARLELAGCGVDVRLSTRARTISACDDGGVRVRLEGADRTYESVCARYVFNCTYSGLNQFDGDFPGTRMGLKQEITEMALLEMPEKLASLGITVMDGPFFSMMPFPPRGLHTLSHVRYTPHLHWTDRHGLDPYEELKRYRRDTRVDRMVRDVGRYVPAVLGATYRESLFEVKTVLLKNEGDDGRPILLEKHASLPGCYSVLGGKIDNIYDVLETLDAEDL